MRVAVTLLLLALGDSATAHKSKGDEGECSDIDKQQFETLYCTAYVCTGCCSDWCKEKCDGWKAKMEESNCACDADPEAHSSESYCKDDADNFHEEYKDDPWEARMARSCTLGCEECCKGDDAAAGFLQLAQQRTFGHHHGKASAKLQACHACMAKKGLK